MLKEGSIFRLNDSTKARLLAEMTGDLVKVENPKITHPTLGHECALVCSVKDGRTKLWLRLDELPSLMLSDSKKLSNLMNALADSVEKLSDEEILVESEGESTESTRRVIAGAVARFKKMPPPKKPTKSPPRRKP